MKNLMRTVTENENFAGFVYRGDPVPEFKDYEDSGAEYTEVQNKQNEQNNKLLDAVKTPEQFNEALDKYILEAKTKADQRAKFLTDKIIALYARSGVQMDMENSNVGTVTDWIALTVKQYFKELDNNSVYAQGKIASLKSYLKEHKNEQMAGEQMMKEVTEAVRKDQAREATRMLQEQGQNNKNKVDITELSDKIDITSEIVKLLKHYRKYAINTHKAVENGNFSKLGIEGEESYDKKGKSELTKKFQEKAGITDDGWFGPKTKAAMDSILAKVKAGKKPDEAFAEFKAEKKAEAEAMAKAEEARKARENAKKMAEKNAFDAKIKEFTKRFGEPKTEKINGSEYKVFDLGNYGFLPKNIPDGVVFNLDLDGKNYKFLSSHVITPEVMKPYSDTLIKKIAEEQKKHDTKEAKRIQEDMKIKKEEAATRYRKEWSRIVYNDIGLYPKDWHKIKDYTVKDFRDGMVNGYDLSNKLKTPWGDGAIGWWDAGNLEKWIKNTDDGQEFLSKPDNYTLVDFINEKAGNNINSYERIDL